MANILVFGDSIGQGYYDTEGGWVDRLKKYLKKLFMKGIIKDDIDLYNLCVDGDTSKEILSHIKRESSYRVWANEKTIFIFAFGINDSEIILKTNNNLVSEQTFIKNVEYMLYVSKKYSDNIIFIGLTPIEEIKVNPIPWNTKKAYISQEIKKYDKIIDNFCRKNKLDYVHLYSKLTDKDLFDGVHPNTIGHKKIFKIVKNFLEKKKYIQ